MCEEGSWVSKGALSRARQGLGGGQRGSSTPARWASPSPGPTQSGGRGTAAGVSFEHSSSATISSAALAKRFSGDLAMSCRRIATTRGSRRAAAAAGSSGTSPMIRWRSTARASPSNGQSPVSISKRITPSEYRSERASTGWPTACSGDSVLGRLWSDGSCSRERGDGSIPASVGTDLHLRDPEIQHLHEIRVTIPLDEHDVVGLQVPVDDAECVGRMQRRCDAPDDVKCAGGREGPGFEDRPQGLAVDVLERKKKGTDGQAPEVRVAAATWGLWILPAATASRSKRATTSDIDDHSGRRTLIAKGLRRCKCWAR